MWEGGNMCQASSMRSPAHKTLTRPLAASAWASERWKAFTLSHTSFQRSGIWPSSISKFCSSCKGNSIYVLMEKSPWLLKGGASGGS